MNMKTKRIVTIMSICLVALIVIAVVLGFGKKKEDENLYENSSEEIQIQGEGTDQSELEVVEEEPASAENVVVEKAEADFERWLVAGMVVGISLQYPEFEFTEIYLASETEMGNPGESKGAYVVFNCGGEEIALHSKPIEKERTEAGTKDLYTEELGFATFDEVNPSSIAKDECVSVEMDELSELISQSVLVTVYEH